MITYRIILSVLIASLTLVSCVGYEDWTEEEQMLILGPGAFNGSTVDSGSCGRVMRVLSIAEPADSLILRRPSSSLSEQMLSSATFRMLSANLLATVTDPSQDGVGIAGPQVGVLRRVVAVQRFDKVGELFEVYPNIRITAFRGEKSLGPEGCLSIPDRRGDVSRYRDIDITYTSLSSYRDTTERVTGFTAVIFQHECDHLDGIVFTDRLLSTVNQNLD